MAVFFALGRKHALALSGLLLLIFFSLQSLPTWNLAPLPAIEDEHGPAAKDNTEQDGERTVEAALPLPPEYNVIGSPRSSEPQSQFCRDRLSTKFLEDFRDRRAGYCSESSKSELTCFHTVNSGSFAPGSLDSFCIAQKGISFDVKEQKFALDCLVRELYDQEKALGAAPFHDLQSYQYLTGPRYLFNEWMDLTGKLKNKADTLLGGSFPTSQDRERSFLILLKREVDGNLWHCLNEIMAILSTLDVLRITPDPDNGGQAVFGLEDLSRTEIVILDEFPDGPYFDLFQLASGKRPTRITDWVNRRSSDPISGRVAARIPVDKVIVPLAGAANPLWSDWVKIDCGLQDDSVLRVFVRRVFDFYGIPRTRHRDTSHSLASSLALLPSRPKLNVSIVVRRDSRRLMGLDGHLFDAAKSRFSHVADIRLVEFEGKPFQEQVEIARDTDVMVGMHGAGFTHVMFMEEGRGALVEIQPDRLCHRGFRNLAKMTGQLYFVAGANKILGNCYTGAGGGLEQMPDDGTSFLPFDTSRCWSFTKDPDSWSFGCSDPKLTGGEKSYMMCVNSEASDDWYNTCEKKEASDIWWMTRYVMEQERFLKLVGNAIEAVQERQVEREV